MSSSHQHHTPAQSQRGLYWSGGLTGLYFVVELVVGLWTGSIAVISDALHTFSAVGGILIALVAAYFARKPPSPERTFGSQGLCKSIPSWVCFWTGVDMGIGRYHP